MHHIPLPPLFATSVLVFDMQETLIVIDNNRDYKTQQRLKNWQQRGVSLIELMVGIALVY